jgi:D-alanine-D-alanine ligase
VGGVVEGAPRVAGARALEAMVDLRSGGDVAQALRDLGHVARPIAADDDLDIGLRQIDVDACLLALHGRCGGIGDVQSLLTLRNVPYAGPAAAAVALAFDKVRSRQLLAYHNLPVPAAIALGPAGRPSDRALELLGWPCVVKPRRGAHALGVARLVAVGQVREAIERALDIDDEIVLERALDGTEVQVVVLGERVLGSAEVIARPSAGGEGGEMVCPPRFARGRIEGIHALARAAVAALGLHEGLTRVDIVATARHNEIVLEVEPLPSLHRDGVVARVARAAGFAYEDLVGELVDRIMLRVPDATLGRERPLLQ